MLWSVRHRDGWCAAEYKRDPSSRDRVRTLCRHWVMLPWDVVPWRTADRSMIGARLIDCTDCQCRLVGRALERGP